MTTDGSLNEDNISMLRSTGGMEYGGVACGVVLAAKDAPTAISQERVRVSGTEEKRERKKPRNAI